MNLLLANFLLGANNNSITEHPLVVAIGVAIWIIYGLINAATKKAEEQQARQQAAQMPMLREIVPPAPKQPATAAQKTARSKAKKSRTAAQIASTVAAVQQSREAPVEIQRDAFATAASSIDAPKKKESRVDANALRAWLRPETLRKQFILTEIMQPPVALRDNE